MDTEDTQKVKEEPRPHNSSTSEHETPSSDQLYVEGPVGKDREPIKSERQGIIQKRSTETQNKSNVAIEGFRPKISQKSKSGTGEAGREPDIKICTRTCHVCQKTFRRSDTLKRHMRAVHIGERPYVCEYCCATYKHMSHLKEHVESKHTLETYECEKCGKSFWSAKGQLRHQKHCGKEFSERVAFRCSKCEKGFISAKGYRNHGKKCSGFKADGTSSLNDQAKDLPVNEEPLATNRSPSEPETQSSNQLYVEEPESVGKDQDEDLAEKEDPLPHNSSASEPETPSSNQLYFVSFPFLLPESNNAEKESCETKGEIRGVILKVSTETSNKLNEAIEAFKPEISQKSESGTGDASQVSNIKIYSRTCHVCQKTFRRSDTLKRHMRAVHIGERPYVCEYCCATYKQMSHLKEHVESKHILATPSYKCEKCDKSFWYASAKLRHKKDCGKELSERVAFRCSSCQKGFITAKGYRQHQRKCGESKGDGSGLKNQDADLPMPFSCAVCGKRFASAPSLHRHQNSFCGKKPQSRSYICDICGKDFHKRIQYTTHTYRHMGVKPFKCPRCDACFYEKLTLQRHIDRHDGKKRFKCSLCDLAYTTKPSLSLHVRHDHSGSKPYKCSECESSFVYQDQLSEHIQTVHGKVSGFKCKLCDKESFDLNTFLNHMRNHTLPPRRIIKQHMCKLCQKSFCLRDLHHHIESEHPGMTLSQALASEVVKCNICSKDFASQNHLDRHIRIVHSERRPFKCQHCNKSFKVKITKVLHERLHTDFRPHGCQECGKMFRFPISMTEHMRMHHPGPEEVRKFSCRECDKSFTTRYALKKHMWQHSDVEPFTCSECGKGFVTLFRLKSHMALKHERLKP
ncbi:zinc finger protein 791-like [Littorina saxatilis]|uniref:zinc finger protein 791-like n=1 Tax=Littorina saxatilis TaxID=31220 RepID=UPI0038B58B74